ncbi:MAG: glutamate synthase large subunit [Halobacteriales archaeon]|nr:glutamate synthase large subunit [Halobacteriales archaeon]
MRHTERKGINARERSNCGVGVLMEMSGEKSHEVVEDGLEIVENLDHRGARGAEENTGDGAGILIQKPHAFFAEVVDEIDERGLGFDDYGVGQVFLPQDDEAREAVVETVEDAVSDEGFEVVAWRDVPTDNDGLGETALEMEPDIRQVFVTHGEDVTGDELDSALYVLRRVIEKRAGDVHDRFYVCSLDRRKVVYKGLLTNAQVRTYFKDLSDERVETSLALVHSRFSTNTLGSWELAHPFRNIIHNGEINTLRGNLNWMSTREADLESDEFDVEKLKPVTKEDQSDTAVVDNVLELLVEGGRELPHALRMLIPEAWDKDETMDDDRRDWYDYHSTIMEPWDGPALVAFTDGHSVGAVLDRNGLRPCRYTVTEDDRLIMASETGVLETSPDEVKEKGRLQPGQMFYADPDEGRIVPDEEVFDELTDDKYGEWLNENRVRLDEFAPHDPSAPGEDEVRDDVSAYHRAFGYTEDLLEKMFKPMSVEGHDPVGSMGDDTPLSALSDRNKTLFTYFKQLFAQVSNPPIDHLREDLVTSLESHIGRQRNMLGETPEHCGQVKLESPVLSNEEFDALVSMDENGIRATTLDITYEKGEKTLEEAVEDVRADASEAVEEGYEIIVLSDRATDENRVPIPSLLAVGGVHHHLIREGTRTDAGIVLESGQPFLVHHFCTLIGYGADAVNPYLAYETIAEFGHKGELRLTESWREEEPTATPDEAVDRYVEAVEDGILKVMSKMGISTLESYKGAQIFEAVGLKSDFVDEYFYGTTARTEGIGVEGVENDLLERHDFGFEQDEEELDPGGEIEWTRNGEFHAWRSGTVRKLQAAVREDDYETYKEFSRTMNHENENLHELRGLLELESDRERVPVEEVEPAEDIVKRFFTGSMSFGSLSKEAHETLAEAMNRIGAKSGSGEGGEPVERFGTERRSKIKQVASGRFGVTVSYLNDAEHIEIKMAQGSKPGEGGHLPGHKVNETIASTRHTTPGVALISPPPQHDIYSIEDLAQLIHDLKCSNPDADVHVKLVAEDGVGIIAAGVSKARADSVLISGHAGGTGASPRTSIQSAGLPWELGIAEAHQVLMENDLRSRIRVRVDGGMKTGRDIVVAALLGAEEYGFGTSALVSEGCVMVRKCHTNKCPTGIATQDEERRQLFRGEVEHVVNYMEFMAQEVREYMAELGFRTMDEMIGEVDALGQREVDHPKASGIDLSRLLRKPDSDDDPYKTREQNHRLDDKIDHELIGAARRAIEDGEPIEVSREIRNRDRTTGAMLSSEIAKAHGEDGLADDTVKLKFEGSAGQSFGAFAVNGMTMHVTGDANDYVGKGLSGGKLVVETPDDAGFVEDENIIIGNVALYGATDGEAYFNGVAGERFAVRNSGVKTVVEGVGDHGCEYMTGGVAVVLGETGRNFGAGMSGGEAYVLDEAGDFEDVRLNDEMVHVEPTDDRDEKLVRRMVENHLEYTDSEKAREVLENWDDYFGKFVKVMPNPYARVVKEHMEQGEDIRVSPPPEPPAGAATDGGASEAGD